MHGKFLSFSLAMIRVANRPRSAKPRKVLNPAKSFSCWSVNLLDFLQQNGRQNAKNEADPCWKNSGYAAAWRQILGSFLLDGWISVTSNPIKMLSDRS